MESYVTQLRTGYMPWTAGAYAKKGWEFCVGSAKDCDHFVEQGAIRLSWGEDPEGRQYKSIRSLVFKPGKKGLRDSAVPAFVRELVNLEHLSIPSTMVVGIEADAIPDSLVGLTVWNVEGADTVIGESALRWPADVSLQNVKALRFLDEQGSNPPNSLLGITPKGLPSLDYVECLINKATRRLEALAMFPHLNFAWLEFVNNHDIFAFMPSPVSALSLVSADKKFPFVNIKDLSSVELLRLNAVKCEIDCEVLAQLPRLREICVYNSRNITNAGSLVACKRLVSIEFVACGRPFDDDLKQLLQAKKYERLDIDFA